jgi:hypothetical protein
MDVPQRTPEGHLNEVTPLHPQRDDEGTHTISGRLSSMISNIRGLEAVRRDLVIFSDAMTFKRRPGMEI